MRVLFSPSFVDGLSNDQFMSLVFLYRRKGFAPEEAIARVKRGLAASPNFTGAIGDSDEQLLQRILAVYGYGGSDILQRETWHKIDRDTIAANSQKILRSVSSLDSYKPRSKRGILHYIEKLLAWKAFQDAAANYPELIAHYDSLYPYYRINRKRGYYPLPASVQTSWTKQCHVYRRLLLQAKYLEPAPFKPSARAHICKYYRILV